MRRTASHIRRFRPAPVVTTHVVRHRRRVDAAQLEIGMYVVELDRPWSETPFMFQGFRIDSTATLAAVRESCRHAFVETEKLARVSSNSPFRLVGDHRATH